jgi:hypothetical protein
MPFKEDRQEATVSGPPCDASASAMRSNTNLSMIIHRLFHFPWPNAMPGDVVLVVVVPLEHLPS